MAQRTLSRTIPALLPTPGANDANGGEGETRDARRETGDTGGPSLRDLPHLLPTPVATDAYGSRRSTARTEEWTSNPGTSLTDAVWEAEGRTTDTRGELTPAAGGTPKSRHRLLPTPTAEDGERGQGGSGTDRLGTGTFVDGDVRLLPTPQAADGDGGRQEKGAMSAGGVRPSGQKATLPLPTAVSMRETISETPFAQVEEGEQAALFDAGTADGDALLPTPVANPDNPGAGGELRAAIVHGEGRRNETGVDTLGRPNTGRARQTDEEPLLPTPKVTASRASRRAMVENSQWCAPQLEQALEIARGELPREFESWDEVPGHLGRAAAEGRLLPTPTTQDGENCAGPSQRERNSDPLNVVAADAAEGRLLPTPQTGNRKSRKAMTASTDNGRRSGGGNSSPPGLEQIAEIRAGRWPKELPPYEQLPPETRAIVDSLLGEEGRLLPTPQAADGERSSEQGPRYYAGEGDNPTLLGAARRSEVSWGVYEPAVRRWEMILGREAPAPTDEKGRLDPPFVEWMLGYPEGWFDLPGLRRTAKLRALGNSVQVQCGEVVGVWARELVLSGVLFEQDEAA